MIEIRSATDADADALAGLLADLGYPVGARDLPARLARFRTSSSGRVLVATLDGVVVGFAAVEMTCPIHQPTPVAHISAFAVRRASRRQGVGRALLAAVDEEARREGCGRMVVTSAERRAEAHAFYLATGWTQTGRHFAKPVS